MFMRGGYACGVVSLTCALTPTVGCTVGDGQENIVVTLELTEENFRDLPVVSSGKTSLLGQDVADSHGTVAATVRIDGAEQLVLSGFELAIDVDGAPLEHELVRLRVNESDAGAAFTGTIIADGDVLRADFRATPLDALVQPQGAAYTAALDVSWREEGVFEAVETGVATLEVPSFIAASVNTTTFQLVAGEPQAASLALGATSAELRASVEVKNGLTVDVSGARMRATFFGVGALPALGLALVDQPALQIDDAAATNVAPAQVLDVYTSTSPTDDGAAEEPAGTAAATGDVSGGKALVTLELDYAPTDGTAGATTDVLSFVADVP